MSKDPKPSGLIEWTLENIRNEGESLRWMELRRMEWVPLLASRLKYLFDGASFLFFCDDEREWFEKYFLQNINRKDNSRPILPFINLRSLYPRLDKISTVEERMLLEDMLSISFPNGFVYFYVGKQGTRLAQVAESRNDSFLWMIDDAEEQNSFYVANSNDENIDFKLMV